VLVGIRRRGLADEGPADGTGAPVARIVTGHLDASPEQSRSRSRKHDADATHQEQGSIAHPSV
jgi:hypothetical protein